MSTNDSTSSEKALKKKQYNAAYYSNLSVDQKKERSKKEALRAKYDDLLYIYLFLLLIFYNRQKRERNKLAAQHGSALDQPTGELSFADKEFGN
jgi:hypothetical protein